MSRELRLALERVARRIREYRLWVGLALCWAAWILAGAVLIALGVSHGAMLAGLAALSILSGVLWVVVAMRSARDPRGIARRVEAAYPDLDAVLLTAVEEGCLSPPGGRLGYLQEAVVSRTLEHHRSHDWGAVVPGTTLLWARLAHLTALAGLVAVCLVLGWRLRTGDALAAGLTEAAQSDVQVTPGDTEIEKGSALLVVARFPNQIPPAAKLVLEQGTTGATSRAMSRSLEDPTFAGRVESVSEDLSYHIEFAETKSPSYRVHVFENPELTRTDAKLEFPSYTAMESRTAEDIRHLTALEGTRVTLQFRLNKEVASAKLVDEAGTEIDLTSPGSSDPSVYSTAFTLADSHRYKIRLVDRDGRTNKLAADLGVNVTRNRPPTISMSQPGHDVRVSPVEELRLKAQASDDLGVIRHGVNVTLADEEPKDVILGEAGKPIAKRVQVEHLIDFEAMKAVPDQLVTYFVWAEDFGPDGKPRRTEGDMYFAEVRHFEEIFRQGEQAPAGSAENEEQQQGGNAQRAEQLAELQKEIINGTWKILRRETEAKPTDKLVPDVKLLRESQESALTQLETMSEQLRDKASRASADAAGKSMKEAIRLLGESADKPSTEPLQPALAAERLAYQSLLKLRAREFEVTRNNSRQRGGRGSGSAAMQRQLNQLELTDRENRFEEQRRANQDLSKKEQEQRETRQVLSRLKELAQRQADLNERLKELQSALQAAKDEQARQEIERQLKRLREQQQEVLRDTDELQERMENEQNRERMAESRQQVQDARDHARQASEALEQGRVPQALNEGTRASEKLSNVRDELRKQSSNQFSDDLTEMRNQARELDENQERLTEKLDAWKESARQTLRDTADRGRIKQDLERQQARLEDLVDRMRKTVTEAEETEPLLAKNLFDTTRKADEQAIPQTLKQAGELADAGFADEATRASRQAGEGIDGLREGVEQAARSVLGDETAALRRAQSEVEELEKQLNKEIAQATGQDPSRLGRRPSDQQKSGNRQGQRNQQPGQPGDQPQAPGEPGARQPQPDQQNGQGAEEREGGSTKDQIVDPFDGIEMQPAQQQGQQGQGQRQGQEQGQGQSQAQGQEAQKGSRGRGSLRGSPGEQNSPGAPGGSEGNPTGGRATGADSRLGNLGGQPNGPGGPITGEGFRQWSDRMREVEELLDDPALRAEAGRIRDRVRGERENFRRHAQEPKWDDVKSLVADPIRELGRRIAEEVLRRESPDSLVPIDRDPVPPRFAEGVRRYRERLGSGQ